MKAKIILTSILLAFCAEAFAQDIIHTTDRRTIEAKILEITDEDILYKTYDNLGGPDYRMSIDRVERIVFENGTEKTFSPAAILVPGPYAYDYYDLYGPLEYRWGHYYDRYGHICSDSLYDYLGVSMYGSKYRKAQNQLQWGLWLTMGGAALLTTGIVCGAMQADYNRGVAQMRGNYSSYGIRGNDSSSMEAVDIATGIVGAAGLGAGITLLVKGNKKMNEIADDYNLRYGRAAHGSKSSLNVGTTAHGIGLAFNF